MSQHPADLPEHLLLVIVGVVVQDSDGHYEVDGAILALDDHVFQFRETVFGVLLPRDLQHRV